MKISIFFNILNKDQLLLLKVLITGCYNYRPHELRDNVSQLNNKSRTFLLDCYQVKKIARRQTQDNGKGKKDGENGDKSKSKSPNMKKEDDSESDSSFVGNESSLTGNSLTLKAPPTICSRRQFKILHFFSKITNKA